MPALTSTLALFGLPLQGGEILLLALLGVLVFGKRLPEVGRSLGKGIVEFKKGLAGVEDDADRAARTPPPPQVESRPSAQLDAPAAPTTSSSAERTHSA